jgi:hypothetical protein
MRYTTVLALCTFLFSGLIVTGCGPGADTPQPEASDSPQEEAVYPQVEVIDGEQMNAMNDYVIRMTAEELPPAGAFWSLTLYDRDQG